MDTPGGEQVITTRTREGTPERGDTRCHPRQRKGSFLPERMTNFCYLFFFIFPLCVGNGVGK